MEESTSKTYSNELSGAALISTSAINEISKSDIKELEVESMGWVYVSEGAYLHEGSDNSDVIQVVGTPQISMSESNILWLL